ncbi:MAG: methyl-accepting chemotaxis protein [Beijerinckiaceae bacterium]|nr:methyl-accepting chemotaxis protein [Beijerinckiaceae bacterium]
MLSFMSRMSITRQFSLLAILGVALTLAGLTLALKRSSELAFSAKQAEVQHLTEAAASLLRNYVQLEQSGVLPLDEAKKRALEALAAMRFDNANYYFVYDYDGVLLANPKKDIVGTNLLNARDSSGQLFVQSFLEIAKSGHPGNVTYHWAKTGEAVAQPKVSYVIGVPEWQWLVGTGLYVDDVYAAFVDSAVKLAMIFAPLLAGFLIIVYFMRRSVSTLLSTLAEGTRRLAHGDLDAPIAGRGRLDEIGQMAEAMVTFRQAAIDKGRLEQETEKQRQVLEQERRLKAEVDQNAMIANRFVVDSLGEALASLSQGDLSLNVAQPYSPEYESIRENFNAAVAQLRETMMVIASNTTGIRSGSVEMATAADDLAQRTERQAAALAETAASLAQIGQTVGETARGATLARQIVATAISDAEKGGAVVSGAVAAMGEIEKSAQQISQIIGVIDEIAFQTNLLALNAGVEAARAGDAGRGFAVVASEVRALAQRSAEAAKDIKALILASATQVGKGVEQVAETGKALDRIHGRIAEINELVMKIATSAQHQATSLSEVNQAIDQMDKATQQNAAMVEESTAASHSLASEADQLASLVDRFSLGDDLRGHAPRGTRRAA